MKNYKWKTEIAIIQQFIKHKKALNLNLKNNLS